MRVQSLANQMAPTANLSAARASAQEPAQPAPADQVTVTSGEPEKEWTVLLYLNGNNALTGQAMSNLRLLEYVGSDDQIDFVAQAARPEGLFDGMSGDWSGVRRYKIEHNGEKLTPSVMIGDLVTGWMPGKTKSIESPVVEDLGNEIDMGSADTLEDFLEWGMNNYPAKRYMVVMLGPNQGLSGMMKDTISGSEMSVGELGQAFANVKRETGKKIDVLALNGSATTTMEVAYELKDNVKYLVGSQGIQSGAGMPLAQIANELKSANSEEGQDALTMVRYWTLMNSMVGSLAVQTGGSSTISAIDLDQMGGVKDAWDDLGQALLAADVGRDKLNELLDQTQDFQGKSTNEAYQNSRDAIHFAKLVKEDEEITDATVKAAAQAAIDAVDRALVGDAASGKYLGEANGMSVFAPTHYGFFRPQGTDLVGFDRKAGYEDTQFAKDSSWDEVLAAGGKDSFTNYALKKVGLSEESLDGLHANYNQHIGKVTGGLGLASTAGWFNAINAWRGADPISLPIVGASGGAAAGIVGSGYDAFQAIGGIYHAATELGDSDEVVNRVFDLGRAAAKATANLGYVVPELQPYAATAGMLTFLSPWIRDVYSIYSEYKQVKDGIELGQISSLPMVEQWGAAAVRHYHGHQLWDGA